MNVYEKQRKQVVKAFKCREAQLREGGPGSGRKPMGRVSAKGHDAWVNSIDRHGLAQASYRHSKAQDLKAGRKLWKSAGIPAHQKNLIIRGVAAWKDRSRRKGFIK